jgi:coenzyme F420-dependent glucose-6-phosphate dehydrogenase
MQLRIGFYTREENYPLSELLQQCRLAQDNGFDEAWAADHFHPWVHSEAHTSFAWIFLAVAAERTGKLTMGTCVTAPILRYNPAIVAQAFATLGYLYPDRIILGLGTGEAMNELPLGCEWPEAPERIARLEEAIKVIKLLWKKKFASFRGKYYRLRKANLYTRQTKPIPIYVAAGGPKVAKLAGKYADGLITTCYPQDYYFKTLFPALREGAELAGRDPQEIRKVLLYTSIYGDFNLLRDKRWASMILPFFLGLNMYDPRQIESIGDFADPKRLAESWLFSTEPEDYIKAVESYIKVGFSGFQLGNLGTDDQGFLRMCGRHVIPYLKDTYGRES